MLNAEYVSLSRQMGLEVKMDVIANNIANMNTTAYKSESTLFQEYLVEDSEGQLISYTLDWGLVRNLAEGEMTPTGNPFDLAISGTGYFVVETPDGLQYTRNGHFRIDDTGRLVSSDGHPVLDDGGRPIQFGESDTTVTIANDGTVTTESGVIGRIDVVSFDNENLLKMVGDGLYTTDQPPIPADGALVLQGMIERSNVQPILEMTELIRTQRAYSATQRLLDATNDLQRKMLDRIANIF